MHGALELEFVEATAFCGLNQILEQPDDRNHLDLAFVTSLDKCHCTWPLHEDLFDNPSRFHLPFIINCQVELIEPLVVRNMGRLNLKKSKSALSRSLFESVTEDDIFSEQWNDNYVATAKLDRNIGVFARIVEMFTPMVRRRVSWLDKQPWLRGDKAYESSLKKKKKANRVMLLLKDEASIAQYRAACRLNYAAFDAAKTSYMKSVLDDTRGSTREFFNIMKQGSSSLPVTMFYGDESFSGVALNEKMAEFLGSSFLKDVPAFGNTNEEIDSSLLSHYSLSIELCGRV